MKLLRVSILVLALSSVVFAGNIPNAAPTQAEPTEVVVTTPTEVTTIEVVLNLLQGVLSLV
jgi:hypothetical protein